ncbi:hydrogenase nickel incorporation protein HypB [Sulfuritortus calidifontis]|uniref:Hydrogenase maturation factor HypB n=1 Tax=Sulfuritortus calidifontis TaxID=1914471 RepID=A0A4R3JXI8_9PROT|nr:hydrogenase nickel incorporation protein HypB [Sulfuritortus calidifontis]TCS71723.1 hydrogenase nickel incorporation protein HypB [Sulfuritortus calidifontis]
MCDTCGCNLTPGNRQFAYKPVEPSATTVSVLKGLLQKNDDQAAHNRAHFDARGILALNLMSSPGSGKTALLEATLAALKDEFNCAVIEGDLETENDAERIRAQGVQAHQIVTGTACHLDAHLVHDALHHMQLDGVDLLFIENVGNLVCPASFDLGQHLNVTLLSVTEGDDKPAKYPVMFRAADAMLISKTDLLAVLDDFDPAKAEAHLRELANPAPVFRLSAKKGEGLAAWLAWLREQLTAQRARVAQGRTRLPKIQPDGVRLHTA